MPRFSINVAKVPPAGRDYEFTIDPAWVISQLSDCEVRPSSQHGCLKINVSPVGDNFYIKGKIVLECMMTCVRCLGDATIVLDIPLSIVMVRDGTEHMLPRGQKKDFGLARFKGDEIVLDDEIREMIVVELPMNPTCPQGCSIEDLYKD